MMNYEEMTNTELLMIYDGLKDAIDLGNTSEFCAWDWDLYTEIANRVDLMNDLDNAGDPYVIDEVINAAVELLRKKVMK